MRIVIDTNVILSGFLWDGLPWQVFQTVLNGQCVSLTSQALLHELELVVNREKFRPAFLKIKTTPNDVLNLYRTLSELVAPYPIPILSQLRDEKDYIVLACAVGGQADYIITGDKDLLVLQNYETVQIITASQFWGRL